ncbi:MAG TPA: hypothetical protein VFT49_03910 [Candidatus Saccharimonadales bacterium]|nr:hypothetical protein [Candidatus Saccharimonadales bacterium]
MIYKDGVIGRKLFQELESTEAGLSEVAYRFPKSREEYMALDVEQRMRVAMSILEQYANNSNAPYRYNHAEPSASESAPATIETSEPGVVAEVRVEYKIHSNRDILNTPWTRREILPWVSLVDKNKGVATPYKQAGIVLSEIGLARMDGRPFYRTDHSDFGSHSLEEGETAGIIAIVDEAVCGLIDRIISKHQNLGQVAVETAG